MKIRAKDHTTLYDGTLFIGGTAFETLGDRFAIRIAGQEGQNIMVRPEEVAHNFKIVWATPQEWKALRKAGFINTHGT